VIRYDTIAEFNVDASHRRHSGLETKTLFSVLASASRFWPRLTSSTDRGIEDGLWLAQIRRWVANWGVFAGKRYEQRDAVYMPSVWHRVLY